MSASSTIQVQETGEKNKVETDASPSVDRGGVENALLEVEAQIRAQEAAHAQAIARLTQVRDTLRNALDPEGRMKELITALDLERQFHEECLATLKAFGFLGENNQPPSFENVSSAFNLSELEVASRFQSPMLLVMPKISFVSSVQSIDAHKTMRNQIDTYINNNVYGEISDEEAEVENTGWSASIVEGAEEMEVKAHDNTELTLGERVRLAATNREKAAHGIDRQQYAFLQMDGLRKKKPVDRKTWTVLDKDEALSTSLVPRAVWCGDQVGFGGVVPQDRNDYARFRSSVGGDVRIS